MPKANHRCAFSNDPAFLKRIEDQLRSPSDSNQKKLPDQGQVINKKSKAGDRAKKIALRNMESRYDTVVLDESRGILTCTFTGAALLSLNVMVRMHDAQGTGLKSTWLKRIQALTYENKPVFDRWKKVVQYPLVVEEVYVTRENKTMDAESVCAACKPVVDSFVRMGWLPDDSTRYLAHPIPFTFRGNNPGLVITFMPAPNPYGLISDSTMRVATAIQPLPRT